MFCEKNKASTLFIVCTTRSVLQPRIEPRHSLDEACLLRIRLLRNALVDSNGKPVRRTRIEICLERHIVCGQYALCAYLGGGIEGSIKGCRGQLDFFAVRDQVYSLPAAMLIPLVIPPISCSVKLLG